MARTMDMTQGKPAKLILSFALPLLLSSLFQQFYSMVDTIVVGRGVGVSALAAVGATNSLHFFILGFATGLTYGFGTLFAQRFGAGDREGLRHTAGACYRLCVIIAAIITLPSVLGARFLLTLLHTPTDIMSDAVTYLVVVFAAIPVTLLFNLLATMLRSVGDSKTPLIAMVFSSILNIVLDVLFVYVFDLGVLGVALATDLAQILSCMVCWGGVKRSGAFVLKRSDFAPDGALDWALLKLGIPVALMNSITAIGVMLLQSVVNSLGSVYVAGYTAANKLVNFLEQPSLVLGMAMGVYAGQNLGAGRIDRLKKGLRSTLLLALVSNAVIGLVVYLARSPLVCLFIQETEAEAVLPISGQMLTVICIALPSLSFLFAYRNTLQGIGDTATPMLSGLMELIIRMTIALLLSGSLHFLGVCLAEAGAWVGAAVLLGVVCTTRLKRLERRADVMYVV